MKKPNAENKCFFVNLAAELSTQNEVVIQTIDELIAGALRDPAVEDRSDWQEIQHTIEADVVSELTFGSKVNKPHCTSNREEAWVEISDDDNSQFVG